MRWASSMMSTSSPLGSAVMNWLKYLKSALTFGARTAATFRSVWVNERDPVACMTVRPRRANSPTRDSAMTLLPLPGPPVTAMTRLVFPARACSTVCMTRSTANCWLPISRN